MRSVTSGMLVSWHALFKSKSSLAFCSLSSPGRRGRRQDNMIPSVCASIPGLTILCASVALSGPLSALTTATHSSNVPSSWRFNTFITCIVFPRCWLKFNPWLRRSLDKLIMWDFIDQRGGKFSVCSLVSSHSRTLKPDGFTVFAAMVAWTSVIWLKGDTHRHATHKIKKNILLI